MRARWTGALAHHHATQSAPLLPRVPHKRVQLLFQFYGMPLTMVRDLIRACMEVNRQLQNVVASRRCVRARGASPARAG